MIIDSNFQWLRLQRGSNEGENIFKPREATSIARISGGWLLKSTHFFGRSSSMTTQAMVFVPDPAHEWQYDRKHLGWRRLSQKSSVNYGDVTDRLDVWRGCVYRNSFFNANKEMHVSLVFVAENLQEATEVQDNICRSEKRAEETKLI